MQELTLGPSPFLRDPARPSVRVATGPDPAANVRDALAGFDLAPAHGKRVLLKPNAGRLAQPGEGVTTDPRVVGAAMDAFLAVGAQVAVGESPITGVHALQALERTGMAAEARKRGCSLLDMDACPALSVPVPDGVALNELRVCPEVFEYDIIVSLPVMKVHMHTGVTLAVKNMKGCLWRRSKVELHMLPLVEGVDQKPLNIAIADMATVLTPHFSIIDGTVGMEGLGPSAGTTRALNVVVAGADAFAADAVACRLMGRDAQKIPHLRMGAERGCGMIDLNQIAVTPETWHKAAQPFGAAPENLSIEFPNVRIHDKQSCSACQSTLLLFLQKHADALQEYFPKGHVVDIAIGKGHESLPEGTLCIGNCTACHKERGVFVSGCPPVGSQIPATLEKARRSG